MKANKLVAILKDRQAAEGWSDREMARQLSVSNGTWSGIRRGRHGPGVVFIQRVMERFPEYQLDALLFLQSKVIESNNDVSNTNGRAA